MACPYRLPIFAVKTARCKEHHRKAGHERQMTPCPNSPPRVSKKRPGQAGIVQKWTDDRVVPRLKCRIAKLKRYLRSARPLAAGRFVARPDLPSRGLNKTTPSG